MTHTPAPTDARADTMDALQQQIAQVETLADQVAQQALRHDRDLLRDCQTRVAAGQLLDLDQARGLLLLVQRLQAQGLGAASEQQQDA